MRPPHAPARRLALIGVRVRVGVRVGVGVGGRVRVGVMRCEGDVHLLDLDRAPVRLCYT